MMPSCKTMPYLFIALMNILICVQSQIACIIEPMVLNLDNMGEGMLTCSCSGTTSGDEMWWCKDNQECVQEASIQNDVRDFLAISAFGNGILVGVLNILEANQTDSGSYYCKTKDGGSFSAEIRVLDSVAENVSLSPKHTLANTGIKSIIPEERAVTDISQIISAEMTMTEKLNTAPYLLMTPSTNQLFNEGHNMVVKCDMVNSESSDQVTWYKGNNQLESNNKYVIQGNTLTIKSPGSDETGTYSCQVDVHNDNGTTIHLESFITFGESIKIKAMENIKYTEGEIARVVCTATSRPLPAVSWLLGNHNITDIIANGNTSHYEQIGRHDGPHGWKSTLRIYDLAFADAGHYNCSASNTVVTASKVVELKVQDRLAAVWPFLGIVGECTFLIIVILIHERCTKVSYDEDDEYNEETIKINKKQDSDYSNEKTELKARCN